MDNLHLVTGYLGNDHITAMDQGAFNAALIGTGDFVLKKGNVFRAQVIDNNTVRVYDGELMMQGRFVRLEPGKYVDLAIGSGAQGQMRNDLIVVRYTKNESSGVEGVNLEVIKGTAVASNPLDPDCTEGDITNGEATKHEFPLWRIPVDGLNVGTPVALFGDPYNESMQTLPDIRNQMAQLTDNIYSIAARVEKGSYTGDGGSYKFLKFGFDPLLVIVSEETGGVGGRMVTRPTTAVFVRGVTKYLAYTDAQLNSVVKKMWLGLDWYDKMMRISVVDVEGVADSDLEQMLAPCVFNAKDVKYHYLIVGN